MKRTCSFGTSCQKSRAVDKEAEKARSALSLEAGLARQKSESELLPSTAPRDRIVSSWWAGQASMSGS